MTRKRFRLLSAVAAYQEKNTISRKQKPPGIRRLYSKNQ